MCKNTDSKGNAWKSDNDIKKAIVKSNLATILVNSYFDGDDFSNPIKDYLDDRIYDFGVDGMQKIIP